MSQTGQVNLGISLGINPAAPWPPQGIGLQAPITYTAQLGGGGGGETLPLVFGGPLANPYVVDLGMMPATGLQGIVITVDPLDVHGGLVTAPVTATFTGGHITLQPGGGFALAAPAIASGGITSLSFAYTANATIHIAAIG